MGGNFPYVRVVGRRKKERGDVIRSDTRLKSIKLDILDTNLD